MQWNLLVWITFEAHHCEWKSLAEGQNWLPGRCASGRPRGDLWRDSSYTLVPLHLWRNLNIEMFKYAHSYALSFHILIFRLWCISYYHVKRKLTVLGQGESSQWRMWRIFSSLELVYASSQILSYFATSSYEQLPGFLYKLIMCKMLYSPSTNFIKMKKAEKSLIHLWKMIH